MLENEKLFNDQYYSWFICADCHFKNIQTIVLFNLLINNTPFQIQPMDANDNNI
jgi:hypothetical protein